MSWGGQKFFCDLTDPYRVSLGTHRHPWELPSGYLERANFFTFWAILKISKTNNVSDKSWIFFTLVTHTAHYKAPTGTPGRRLEVELTLVSLLGWDFLSTKFTLKLRHLQCPSILMFDRLKAPMRNMFLNVHYLLHLRSILVWSNSSTYISNVSTLIYVHCPVLHWGIG